MQKLRNKTETPENATLTKLVLTVSHYMLACRTGGLAGSSAMLVRAREARAEKNQSMSIISRGR